MVRRKSIINDSNKTYHLLTRVRSLNNEKDIQKSYVFKNIYNIDTSHFYKDLLSSKLIRELDPEEKKSKIIKYYDERICVLYEITSLIKEGEEKFTFKFFHNKRFDTGKEIVTELIRMTIKNIESDLNILSEKVI